MSEKNALQLRETLNKDLDKIKATLGQDPQDSFKSLIQLQEKLNKGLNEKNWFKSVEMLMLTNRFKNLIDSFEETIENSKKILLISAMEVIRDSISENYLIFRIKIKPQLFRQSVDLFKKPQV
jgi:hypothetical protein